MNFNVKEKEIFGILGPNGAGKTTTVKCLCGLLVPTSGTIYIENMDVIKNFFKIQTMTGTMFGNTMIYNRLTGYDNIKYYCRVYNIPNYKEKAKELLKLVELDKWQNQLVENYSLGMKSKLALARTLVHDPEILILDEPTLGLDPKNSLFIRQLLKEMGKTVIITTHNLEVANDVCSRIALLSKGKIIVIDTPENLKRRVFKNLIVEIKSTEIKELTELLKDLDYIDNLEQIDNNKLRIHLKFEENLQKVLPIIAKKKIQELKTVLPNLEEAFLKFTSERGDKTSNHLEELGENN
ncbi:MAG: ATP-binding cassette domain-containing protein [Promethearchaeota archaeon]